MFGSDQWCYVVYLPAPLRPIDQFSFCVTKELCHWFHQGHIFLPTLISALRLFASLLQSRTSPQPQTSPATLNSKQPIIMHGRNSKKHVFWCSGTAVNLLVLAPLSALLNFLSTGLCSYINYAWFFVQRVAKSLNASVLRCSIAYVCKSCKFIESLCPNVYRLLYCCS